MVNVGAINAELDFLKSPSSYYSSLKFMRSPNIFYPEIHEVDLWQV